MNKFFEVQNLLFKYNEENSSNVLKDISLEVKQGEFLAIVGHNGCGKSTLAKHLNAILLPSGGKVYIGGIDTLEESQLYEIRRRVGLVLQNPDNQIVASIVEEDVAFGPENLGMQSCEIRERVDNALKAVGMYEFKGNATYKLSGGQKQRLAIAGIIAMHPDCIVLDEPTAMLDPCGREEVISTLKKLNENDNITIILITHYMEEAALASRVIVMNDGNILMDGTPKDVFSKVNILNKYGLSVPQSTEFMYKLRMKGLSLPLGIIDEDECINEITKILRE